jgi:stage II sporulation protein D
MKVLRVLRVLTVLTVLTVLVWFGACVSTAARPELPATDAMMPATVRVQVKEGTSTIVLAVPIEEYVAGTILSEVDPPSADPRVLEKMYEVQAVISRTYAIGHRGRHAREGFDLCSGTHCQLYQPARLKSSKWTAIVRDAARHTAGQLLLFDGAPALAVYHADCGGRTSSAHDVWGGETLSYLAGVRDSGSSIQHVTWNFDARTAALRDALDADPRTNVGRRLDAIDIAQRDAAGRADQVTLRGARTVTVRGEVFREVVSRAFGTKSMRSTLFTLTKSRDGYTFAGRGFGHGVGLCQAGAMARLQSGSTPAKVLAFYFPGTRITSARQ